MIPAKLHELRPGMLPAALVAVSLVGLAGRAAADGPVRDPRNPPAPPSQASAPPALGPGEEALREAGGRLYLEGRGSGGEPLRGRVSGDVPVVGGAAACVTCHQRSGMGSVEGGVVAPRITGPSLFSPRPSNPSARPAYDLASLAEALRHGHDPAGRRLDPLMPRYQVDEVEVRALAAHLLRLGAGAEPGVEPGLVRVALVLSPDAPPAVSDAVEAVLRRCADLSGARTRRQGKTHYRREDRLWRRWALEVWRLEGSAEGWRAQLERRARAAPPLLLLSGAGADWGPVQGFCDAGRVPCLLPSVDTPPEPAGVTARYFTAGALVEARAMAAELFRGRDGARLLQVHRAGPGTRGAATLAAAARKGDQVEIMEVAGPLDARAVAARATALGAEAVVLWLEAGEARAVMRALPDGVTPWLGASLLGPAPELRSERPAMLSSASALPAEAEPRWIRLAGWLGPALPAARRAPRAADEAAFACELFGDVLDHAAAEVRRDYLLELFDHTAGMEAWSAYHGRAEFGPGQSILSKGCLVATLGPDGPGPGRWVVPALSR